MKHGILILVCTLLSQTTFANCPTELSKSQLLGKVSDPSKFYTPIRSYCSDELLNIFSNCIESDSAEQTLFFGSREKHYESTKTADCPFGYATEARGGYLRFQKFNGKPVCLEPCETMAVGKFFRDQDKFGAKRALNIGDQIYIPQLKGLRCGKKIHKGCVRVSHFIEYTDKPIVDLYSGICSSSISRGVCRKSNDSDLPKVISIYKVENLRNPANAENQISFDTEDYLLNF